jgi:hypothetical protein
MMKLLRYVPILLVTLSIAAQAQSFDCQGPRFRGEGPQINEVHIFCGEIRYGKDEGYHSELVHSPLVAGVENVRPVGKLGVYEGQVHFTNGGVHRSTFFPRTCSLHQIESSIRYAVSHPFFGNRGDWSYGPSAPLEGGAAYCVGDDGRALGLQFAVTERGGVNTAFPDGRR